MTIKPHIKAAIETKLGTPLGARNATPNLHRCGAWTLLGLDADTLAHQARVDPTPLTAAGELAALLTSRNTYELTQTSGHLQLDYRAPDHITGRPPGRPTRLGIRFDVVPTHKCNDALTHLGAPSTLRPPPRQQEARRDQPPPF